MITTSHPELTQHTVVGHYGTFSWEINGSLIIDRDYQRYLNKNRVEAIVAAFDPDIMGVLICSRRDDGNVYVLDGQHRLEASLVMYGRNAVVPCFILEGLDAKQEAAVFWKMNKHRLHPSSADTFRARLAAEEPVALAIKDICEHYDVNIQLYPQPLGPRDVGAFAALEKLYSAGTLEVVLRILRTAWPKENGAMRANMLLGMHTFFMKFMKEFLADTKYGPARTDRLIEVIANVTPREIERRATTYQETLNTSRSTSIARSFYYFYNRRLKLSRLRIAEWSVDDDNTGDEAVEDDGEA